MSSSNHGFSGAMLVSGRVSKEWPRCTWEAWKTWMVLAFGWKYPATLSVNHPNVSIGGRLREIVWASCFMNHRHPTCLEIWKMDAWEKEDSFLLAGWNGSHFCDPMEPRCLRKVSFRSPSSQPENNSNSSGLGKKHIMFILEMLASFWSNHCFVAKKNMLLACHL